MRIRAWPTRQLGTFVRNGFLDWPQMYKKTKDVCSIGDNTKQPCPPRDGVYPNCSVRNCKPRAPHRDSRAAVGSSWTPDNAALVLFQSPYRVSKSVQWRLALYSEEATGPTPPMPAPLPFLPPYAPSAPSLTFIHSSPPLPPSRSVIFLWSPEKSHRALSPAKRLSDAPPGNETEEEHAYQSINQSNQSTNQILGRITNQSINQPADQSINQSTNQPGNQPTHQSINQSTMTINRVSTINQSINQSATTTPSA